MELLSFTVAATDDRSPIGGRLYNFRMASTSRFDAQFRAALDRIPAHVWCAAPTGGLTFINAVSGQYLQLLDDHPLRLGIDVNAAWDSHVALLHEDDHEETRRVWSTCLRTGTSGEVTFRVRHPSGSYRWFVSRAEPVRDEDGTLLYWIGANVDIEDHKQATFYLAQATDALRKSEMELRQVLDLTPLLIAALGANRERIFMNRTALAYLGLTLEEWRRGGAFEVHPDDVEHFKAETERSLASGLPYEVEVRLRRHDGVYRWVIARYNPVGDGEGKILRWYVACTDIEDRKQAADRLQQENIALREDIAQAFEEIIGRSSALRQVLAHVGKVAGSNSTVLISGETGTGKELVARAIHRGSARVDRAFIAVNCAAVPHSLIGSELFGHERGAFTGATRRRLGRFELAQGGTLFLDEVGELPMEIQVALLRVLQEREFERVGGTATIRADVRLIAATNRDLPIAIAAGTFRSDLFYRLNVFPISVPPLRERSEDVPLLVEFFMERYARQAGKRIRRVNKRALERLQSYPWPGNVRELQNVIERSVILSEGDELTVDGAWLSVGRATPKEERLPRAIAAHEKEIIEAALRATHGRVYGPSGAAARLGIPRSTLESKIRALGINKNRFRE
jgi:PAS domain S-box-containing protein